MATSTSNYRLTKPDGTDLVDIDELNGNFDIIDRQLKANADAAAGKQDKLVFDTAPMSGSTKPVTSGGIYTALGRKQDKLTEEILQMRMLADVLENVLELYNSCERQQEMSAEITHAMIRTDLPRGRGNNRSYHSAEQVTAAYEELIKPLLGVL